MTKEQLHKLEDHDLTYHLACAVYPGRGVQMSGDEKVFVPGVGIVNIYDYNWLMPLVIDCELNILSPHPGEKWNCFSDNHNDVVCDVHDTNPHRALSICLILNYWGKNGRKEPSS